MRGALRLVAVVAAVGAGCAGLTSCGGSSGGTYTASAELANADNLFAPTPVEELGVRIGTVTKVVPDGRNVRAIMSLESKYPVPSGARADVTQDTILGQSYIAISPGYTGGPRLQAGTLIPLSRTSVPATTDQLLSSLNQFLGSIQPPTAAGAINSLAAVLQGQGEKINQLISNGTQTISLLNSKGNELGQLMGTLAHLTGTLNQQSSTLSSLIQNYNTVSGVIADNRNQLADAINQLNNVSTDVTSLVRPNLAPLEQDVAVLTQFGRSLDRNLGPVDLFLYAMVRFWAEGSTFNYPFNGVEGRYDMDFPSAAAEGVSPMIDRIASICRRLNIPSCGNPQAFGPYVSQLTDDLTQLTTSQFGGAIPPPPTTHPPGRPDPGVSGPDSSGSSATGASTTAGSGTATATPATAGGPPASSGAPSAGPPSGITSGPVLTSAQTSEIYNALSKAAGATPPPATTTASLSAPGANALPPLRATSAATNRPSLWHRILHFFGSLL